MMKTILCMLVVMLASPVAAQPGSGSAGSGSAAGSDAPAAGSGSSAAVPAPPDFPMPAGVKPTKVCLDEMDKDPGFADYIIKRTEQKLKDKVNNEQVLKDQCTIKMHQDSQDEVATNQRHVLLAYIAMWLVAAGFVVFMWRKQQALKLEILNLRRDLDEATKDSK
jgi:hypothetical protein